MWLLPIFVAVTISSAFTFFLTICYLPGWEVLFRVIEGFPLAFGIPIFFVALASTAASYCWHFHRLHGTDDEPEPSTLPPLVHAVVVVSYKEPLDVLSRTMDSIIAQRGICRRPIVVFASEERDDTAQSTFSELSKQAGNSFDMFLLTKHPLVEGETIGKSSNENFAVQELYRRLVEEDGQDPFEVLVTIVDADSILSSTYLAHSEHSFRSQRDGRRLIYSGPLSVHRNFADAGLLTQCYELNRCHGDTFHDPFSMYQPQSNYSLTLGFAQEIGFWTPDLMPEDIHTANKARINNFGSRTTVAIPSIICNDLVVSFSDRYTQAMRHQMGSITEFAWGFALYFESKASFPGWWAVFSVEAGREGSFCDIARSMVGYGCKLTVYYLITAHWSMLHWKARLYLSFALSCTIWRSLWFWISELFLWQSLLHQFPIKRPSTARWLLIVCTMPLCSLAGEMIFYFGATLHCLLRITFVGELSYVCAPKGDALKDAKGLKGSSQTSEADS
jgi:cellulose synthase/poly-beta-1,6-N-acetylglucosamine synthase-like glycosyltransferase